MSTLQLLNNSTPLPRKTSVGATLGSPSESGICLHKR